MPKERKKRYLFLGVLLVDEKRVQPKSGRVRRGQHIKYGQLHLRMHRDSPVAHDSAVQEKRVVHMLVYMCFSRGVTKGAICCVQEEERGVEGRRVLRAQDGEEDGNSARSVWDGWIL